MKSIYAFLIITVMCLTIAFVPSCTRSPLSPDQYPTDTVISTIHDTVYVNVVDTVTIPTKHQAFVMLQEVLDQELFPGDITEYVSMSSLPALNNGTVDWSSVGATSAGIKKLSANKWNITGILYSNNDALYYLYSFDIQYSGGDIESLNSWDVSDSNGNAGSFKLSTKLPTTKALSR